VNQTGFQEFRGTFGWFAFCVQPKKIEMAPIDKNVAFTIITLIILHDRERNHGNIQ
jgi:hypothetical protein